MMHRPSLLGTASESKDSCWNWANTSFIYLLKMLLHFFAGDGHRPPQFVNIFSHFQAEGGYSLPASVPVLNLAPEYRGRTPRGTRSAGGNWNDRGK